METVNGKSLSPGLAIGPAVVVGYELQRRFAAPEMDEAGFIQRADVGRECDRMDGALRNSERDLNSIANAANDRPSLAAAVELMSVHAAMATEIAGSVKDRISSNLVGVEDALDSVISQWVARLQQIDNDYLRERELDVRDVGQRMMRHLTGVAPDVHVKFPPGAVVVSRELVPSDAIALANSDVVAIVTEFGGKLGHTAIIARSLGIPAISGISNVTQRIPWGSTLLVDGTEGTVTVEPTEKQQSEFASRVSVEKRESSRLDSIDIQPCRTRDGTEISIFGNIGLQQELNQVLRQGLKGVGLFRTEFLYLESQVRPDTLSQQRIYAEMANELGDRPLVIRTFDLGGDKLPPFLSLDARIAPSSLDLRGLRFSLVEADLLRQQLAAIIQIAQSADVRILFPMVIGGHDFRQAIAVVEEVMDCCDALRRPLIGAMIETPAALFCLDEILELADFIAIGTNDLTQYLLAADRDLSADNEDFTAMHPAVLRAINQVIEAAGRWNRPVCVCGEEAGEPMMAEILIGLGIQELSVSPSRASDLRIAIGAVDIAVASALGQRALTCGSPDEVRELLSPSGRAGVLKQNGSPTQLLGASL